jgi:hypothetical protein
MCSIISLNIFFDSPMESLCFTETCGAVSQIRTGLSPAGPVQLLGKTAVLHDVGSTFTLLGKLPVYLACLKAHLTHAFLSCDTANDCEATHQVTTCPYPGNRPVAASTVQTGATAAEVNTRG